MIEHVLNRIWSEVSIRITTYTCIGSEIINSTPEGPALAILSNIDLYVIYVMSQNISVIYVREY
jgi:hypothetical protein